MKVMSNPNLVAVPSGYHEMLEKLLVTAKEQLLAGNKLPSVYFVGNTVDGTLQPIPIDTDSAESKDTSAKTARNMAQLLNADFVVLMAEAWALPASKVGQAQLILEKYGSVSAYPKRVDIAWFHLETYTGGYSASVRIMAVPPSKRKRMLGEVAWVKSDAQEGRLAGILPEKTLH